MSESPREKFMMMKCQAFDNLKLMARDESFMKNSGFKSLKDAILYHVADIEKAIRKWEKEHPDD